MRVGILLLLLLFSAAAHAASSCRPTDGAASRKGILNAMRGFVKQMSGLDVVFVVRHLKADCNWAWIEAEPQSADGKQRYEPVNALLARRNGKWLYVEGPPEWPICEEDPDCVDRSRYFQKLAARHPGLSPDIFPGAGRIGSQIPMR